MAKRAKASAKRKPAARKAVAQVKAIPAGYRSVTPYLTVRDAPRAIDFYKGAFGAVEKERIYVPDVDTAFKHAANAGCKVLMPLTDMFWGDRFGKLEDPFGNQWAMATHKEDVPPRELGRRAQAAMAQMPSKSS